MTYSDNHLRHVKLFTGHTLRTWDTGRRESGAFSRAYLGYEFCDPQGKVLFHGTDFSPPPSYAIDSDDALRSLLGFLTLKPGDTDDDYFVEYTPEQLAFAESNETEELALYSTEPEEDYPGPEFINLDGWEN